MPTFVGRLTEQNTLGQPNGRFTVIQCIRPANGCPDHVDAFPDQQAELENVLAMNQGLAQVTWHQEQTPDGQTINTVDSSTAPMIQTEPVPQEMPQPQPEVNISMLNLLVVPSRRQGEAFSDCAVRLFRAGGLPSAINLARLSACLPRAAAISMADIPAGPLFGLPVSIFATATCIASGTGVFVGDVIRSLVNCIGLERPVTLEDGGGWGQSAGAVVPAQPHALVQVRGFVERVGGANLWSVGAPACCGTPGFCPAFLTTADPRIAAALNIAARIRRPLAMAGLTLPASESLGGLRVVQVTQIQT